MGSVGVTSSSLRSWSAHNCDQELCRPDGVVVLAAQLAKGGSAGLVSWVQTIVLADTPAAGGRLAARKLQASGSRKQEARASLVAPPQCWPVILYEHW